MVFLAARLYSLANGGNGTVPEPPDYGERFLRFYGADRNKIAFFTMVEIPACNAAGEGGMHIEGGLFYRARGGNDDGCAPLTRAQAAMMPARVQKPTPAGKNGLKSQTNTKGIDSMADKTSGFLAEFKTFIARGNVLDMAVGVIIGGAFGKISTSLVNDIIMPAVSMLTGGVDFSNWKIVLKAAVAGADGAIDPATEVAIRYGAFLATILDFLIIAFAVFCLIKAINSMHRKKEEAPPPPPPEPSNEEKLLTEIRDLLKNR